MNRTDAIELMGRMEEDPEVPYMLSFRGDGQYELSVITYPGKKLTEEEGRKVIDTLNNMKLEWEASMFGVRAF